MYPKELVDLAHAALKDPNAAPMLYDSLIEHGFPKAAKCCLHPISGGCLPYTYGCHTICLLTGRQSPYKYLPKTLAEWEDQLSWNP